MGHFSALGLCGVVDEQRMLLRMIAHRHTVPCSETATFPTAGPVTSG
jgi:hypothetical protein